VRSRSIKLQCKSTWKRKKERKALKPDYKTRTTRWTGSLARLGLKKKKRVYYTTSIAPKVGKDYLSRGKKELSDTPETHNNKNPPTKKKTSSSEGLTKKVRHDARRGKAIKRLLGKDEAHKKKRKGPAKKPPTQRTVKECGSLGLTQVSLLSLGGGPTAMLATRVMPNHATKVSRAHKVKAAKFGLIEQKKNAQDCTSARKRPEIRNRETTKKGVYCITS